MTGAEGPVPRCYRHPGREALVRCTRCDRPICPDCMRPASVGFHCPDDARAGARSIRAPRTTLGARLRDAPPYVTIALIAANVLVYLISGLQPHATLQNPTGSQLFLDWQLFPQSIHNQHRYYELITSAFLHLSLLHIGANMLVLAIIGPPLERLLGWWRYLAVYVIGALGGSAAIYAFGNPIAFTAGASGAIFALFGTALLLVRRLGLDLQWLLATIAINFVITIAVPNISQLGHLGGLVTGLLAGLALGGWPPARRRLTTAAQAGGLAGLAVVVLVVVAVRTATW